MLRIKKVLISFLALILALDNARAQEDSSAICQSGRAALERYQFARALPLLEQCHRKHGEDRELTYTLAQCHQKMGHWTKALQYYRDVVTQDSTFYPAWISLASLQLHRGHYDEAQNRFSYLIVADTPRASYHRKLALVYRKKDQDQKAIHHYQLALKLQSDLLQARTVLVRLFFQEGQLDSASRHLALGLKQDSGHYQLWTYKALIAKKRGKYQKVLDALEKVLREEGDTSDFQRKLLGSALFYQGEYASSRRILSKLTESSEATEKEYYFLGMACRHMGESEKGAYYLERAIKAAESPSMNAYYRGLGRAYEEIQDYPRSIQAYQEAYDRSGKSILLYRLARNYDHYYQDKGPALNYYEWYLKELDPGQLEYREYAQKRLRYLQKIYHFQGKHQ